jgi:hypothetical protein
VVNKKELIEMLEKAVYWEDDFIMKYDNASIWILLKSLPKDKFRKIQKLLAENIADTRKHYQITSELIKKIKEGKYEL